MLRTGRHAQVRQALPRKPSQELRALVPSYQAVAATIAYPTGVNGAAFVAISSEAQLTSASALGRPGNRESYLTTDPNLLLCSPADMLLFQKSSYYHALGDLCSGAPREAISQRKADQEVTLTGSSMETRHCPELTTMSRPFA